MSAVQAAGAPAVRRVHGYDLGIVVPAFALTLLGLLAVWDAGYARAVREGLLFPRELRSQAVAVVFAVVAGALASRVPPSVAKRCAWPAFWVVFALLALVLVPGVGTRIGGAQRWFSVGGFLFQPAEFAKLACIAAVSATMASRPEFRRPRRAGFLRGDVLPHLARSWPLVLVLAAVLLVEREPDLGTAMVMLAGTMAVLFVGGVSRFSIATFVLLGVFAVGALVAAEPFRVARIMAHGERRSEEHSRGIGYQTTIAEDAIRRGGVFGVGLTQGVAKRKLPVPTTDFVMATVAEETGLVGSLGVVGLVSWLVVRLAWHARRASRRFGRLMCAGVAAWIGVQAATNVMMVNGTVPPIGVPMPFVSNGGSSLVALWAALGLCLAAVRPQSPAEVSDEAGGDGRRNRRARLPGG